MRTEEEVTFVLELVRAGWNDCEIAREMGIPRGTVRDRRSGRTPNFRRNVSSCAVCSGNVRALPLPAYTYLLGIYLGDGCLTARGSRNWSTSTRDRWSGDCSVRTGAGC
jgi:hypothetical protein